MAEAISADLKNEVLEAVRAAYETAANGAPQNNGKRLRQEAEALTYERAVELLDNPEALRTTLTGNLPSDQNITVPAGNIRRQVDDAVDLYLQELDRERTAPPTIQTNEPATVLEPTAVPQEKTAFKDKMFAQLQEDLAALQEEFLARAEARGNPAMLAAGELLMQAEATAFGYPEGKSKEMLEARKTDAREIAAEYPADAPDFTQDGLKRIQILETRCAALMNEPDISADEKALAAKTLSALAAAEAGAQGHALGSRESDELIARRVNEAAPAAAPLAAVEDPEEKKNRTVNVTDQAKENAPAASEQKAEASAPKTLSAAERREKLRGGHVPGVADPREAEAATTSAQPETAKAPDKKKAASLQPEEDHDKAAARAQKKNRTAANVLASPATLAAAGTMYVGWTAAQTATYVAAAVPVTVIATCELAGRVVEGVGKGIENACTSIAERAAKSEHLRRERALTQGAVAANDDNMGLVKAIAGVRAAWNQVVGGVATVVKYCALAVGDGGEKIKVLGDTFATPCHNLCDTIQHQVFDKMAAHKAYHTAMFHGDIVGHFEGHRREAHQLADRDNISRFEARGIIGEQIMQERETARERRAEAARERAREQAQAGAAPNPNPKKPNTTAPGNPDGGPTGQTTEGNIVFVPDAVKELKNALGAFNAAVHRTEDQVRQQELLGAVTETATAIAILEGKRQEEIKAFVDEAVKAATHRPPIADAQNPAENFANQGNERLQQAEKLLADALNKADGARKNRIGAALEHAVMADACVHGVRTEQEYTKFREDKMNALNAPEKTAGKEKPVVTEDKTSTPAPKGKNHDGAEPEDKLETAHEVGKRRAKVNAKLKDGENGQHKNAEDVESTTKPKAKTKPQTSKPTNAAGSAPVAEQPGQAASMESLVAMVTETMQLVKDTLAENRRLTQELTAQRNAPAAGNSRGEMADVLAQVNALVETLTSNGVRHRDESHAGDHAPSSVIHKPSAAEIVNLDERRNSQGSSRNGR